MGGGPVEVRPHTCVSPEANDSSAASTRDSATEAPAVISPAVEGSGAAAQHVVLTGGVALRRPQVKDVATQTSTTLAKRGEAASNYKIVQPARFAIKAPNFTGQIPERPAFAARIEDWDNFIYTHAPEDLLEEICPWLYADQAHQLYEVEGKPREVSTVFIKPEGRTILVEAGRTISDYPELKDYEWRMISADTPGKGMYLMDPDDSYFKPGRHYKVPLPEDYPPTGGFRYAITNLWKMLPFGKNKQS